MRGLGFSLKMVYYIVTYNYVTMELSTPENKKNLKKTRLTPNVKRELASSSYLHSDKIGGSFSERVVDYNGEEILVIFEFDEDAVWRKMDDYYNNKKEGDKDMLMPPRKVKKIIAVVYLDGQPVLHDEDEVKHIIDTDEAEEQRLLNINEFQSQVDMSDFKKNVFDTIDEPKIEDDKDGYDELRLG